MSDLIAVQYSWLIPLLPLVGAVIAGFFGARFLKQQSHWPIWIGVGLSALLSLSLLLAIAERQAHPQLTNGEYHPAPSDNAISKKWFTWILAGGDSSVYHTYGNEGQAVAKADGTAHPLPPFIVEAGAWIDQLTVVMLAVVTGIGLLITIFAAGYMKGETGYFRFFAYLGLFIFAMVCLVIANNFVLLYLGWEGVGLCSYLLIGYYYEKPAAREAAKKAFLVNRIGDFGFALGIMLIYLAFGTVSFFGNGAGTFTGALELATVTSHMSHFQSQAMNWIPFLLMLGAFGKSAQFPLYVWLPDAMEGPTPVSALIHAATMVTAGVYMIVRCGTLFVGNAPAMTTVAIVGAFTAIFAATIALRQFDLKKVFAYSTISQLGFMFVGVGALAPVAGIFHLITHAFFKALLFLSSGVVMHAMAGELDMRKFSGLKKVLPKTRWLMLIGCLALSGCPFVSGFFSKDEIVGAAWAHSKLLGGVMLFTAFLTAYYTFRLYFRVFEGPEILPAAPAPGHAHGSDSHDAAGASHSAVETHTAPSSGVDTGQTHHADAHDHGHHDHEPAILIMPLIALAIGALLAGYLNWPGEQLGHFLHNSPSISLSQEVANKVYGEPNVNQISFGSRETEERGTNYLMIVSGLIALSGIGLAYQMHLKDRAASDKLARQFSGITRLLEGKFWVDEVYQDAIVEPIRRLGRAFFMVDQIVINGLVWMLGFIPRACGFTLRQTTQRGYLQGYAATMIFGIAIILMIIFW
jgi:NADH-quinone oxidoreductase subunit L